jgi:hypothetical protein
MDAFHQMLPEDEILLCGAVFLLGLISGGLFRLLAAWRGRRTA